MLSYNIEDLETGLKGNIVEKWLNQQSIVSSNREKISDYIEKGGHAYGFSTFLGHLDNKPFNNNDSMSVFKAHLVGYPEKVSSSKIKGITTIKLCQLSHGFNGVSINNYNRIIKQHTKDNGDHFLDLDTSYGSGDVVSAAWWVKNVLGEEPNFERGDVISLINGSFFTSGLLLSEKNNISKIINKNLDLLTQAQSLLTKEQDSTVQLSVSMRDLNPLRKKLFKTLELIDNTLVNSANSVSGNPLFTFSNGNVSNYSNSSFLDFELSTALTIIQESIILLSSYLRSATLALSSMGESKNGDNIDSVFFVQPAKISTAYLNNIESILNTRNSYSQSESLNIEDIGDYSLIKFTSIEKALPIINKQSLLLEDMIIRNNLQVDNDN